MNDREQVRNAAGALLKPLSQVFARDVKVSRLDLYRFYRMRHPNFESLCFIPIHERNQDIQLFFF